MPSIYRSFLALCTEKPIRKISITDVAERCGISRKTFYYHFPDIDALIHAAIDHELDEFTPLFSGEKTAEEILFAGCEKILEKQEAIRNIVDSEYVGVVRKKLYDYLVINCRPVILGYAKGTLYSEDDIDNLVSIYVVIIMGYLTKWFVMGMGLPSQEIIRKSLKMFENAIPFMLNNVNKDKMHIRFDDRSSVLKYEAGIED